MRRIAANPESGEKIKSDLQNVFVYKFKIGNNGYLLAYSFSIRGNLQSTSSASLRSLMVFINS
ncbi:MAG: hypothetical protein EOM83_05650 [Clostridia bacterium]|nr:hypothetical protein [Clostridia bacterium]